MVLSFFNGSVTTDGTEQNVFDIIADAHFATYIFTNNMLAGDSVRIRVYIYDENAAAMKIYEDQTLTDSQSDTGSAIFVPFLPTKQYKVTIQRTGGTDRSYTWQRIQSS